jgi:hypothetical protein
LRVSHQQRELSTRQNDRVHPILIVQARTNLSEPVTRFWSKDPRNQLRHVEIVNLRDLVGLGSHDRDAVPIQDVRIERAFDGEPRAEQADAR